MFVVCVTSWIKPEHADAYLAECLENARNTRKEPGNLRFDVLRCNDPSNQFFFYEVYRSEDDFKAHQQTPHYFKWRDTVTPWMEKPRVGVRHTSIFPANETDSWKAE
jgi:autoinducer 2-degrading protein